MNKAYDKRKIFMIELRNVHIPPDADEAEIKRICAEKLKVRSDTVKSIRYIKKSVDARKKDNIFFNATLLAALTSDEKRAVSKCADAEEYIEVVKHEPLKLKKTPAVRPIVCGAGPAGLFAALMLAEAGAKPLLIERGADADTRKKATESFFASGVLDERTNVQFGEGGAGTFSDGKLTTNIHDPRCRRVLEIFYECGAPEEILYLAKPHLGTDNLCNIVKNIRERIISAGGEVRFLTRLTDIACDGSGIRTVTVEHDGTSEVIPCEKLIIAAGHSARDVFEMLKCHGAIMEQKPFSIGVRAEHSQEAINLAQYGKFAKLLPPADYKLACHLNSGRSVYTFCMCPGGTVVAASSEEGHLVINGMSRFARDGKNANSALLVNVEPSDFGSDDVLAGIDFQQKYERLAFYAGGGNYRAPAQRLGDFMRDIPSVSGGKIEPTYPLGVAWGEIKACLPFFAVDALREAVTIFAKKISGFDDPDTVLTGVETRSSSPVRIKRDESFQASIRGLYPCGEGAGYAGGIMSAAVDGIRIAEEIIEEYR